MSPPVIVAENIRKKHEEGLRLALAGVSLEVAAGELVCIVGPSGSGKSTLLGILGGLDASFEGRLELFGRDLRSLSDRELARLRGQRIGFIFQSFHLLAHLSVLDNVLAPSLFAAAHRVVNQRVIDAPPKRARERALAVLERMGLADRAFDKPNQLSGGQRQRVAIARALVEGPDLLLCDEPTGNLDVETGAQIIELFRELHRERGLALVVVTHEERLARIATRTLHMREGLLSEQPSTTHLAVAGSSAP